jgi:protein gp37
MWNPWRGCRKYAEGCKYCYIHKGDAKRGVDTSEIVKTDSFCAPVAKKKNGEYKMKPGIVYTCFQTDFLIEDADAWRGACWAMIRERADCHFIFLTKRIARFSSVAPVDWGDGYDNVTVGVSCENQQSVDERLSVLKALPIKHRNIILQPLIEHVDIAAYLAGCELVMVGGEYDTNARPLNFAWVLGCREQCVAANVPFQFRQCGTHFIKDGKKYTLAYHQLGKQAKAAGIDWKPR